MQALWQRAEAHAGDVLELSAETARGQQRQQLELEFGAPKPIVKWAGGKSGVLPQLRAILPEGAEQRRYLEPFAGGAALFFGLMPRCAILSDVNAQLVATYRCVQSAVEPLIERLRDLAQSHCCDQYYDVRERYNATGDRLDTLERAADFIYLNKTCFNGLHRVNRRGHFNVPMGRYQAPRIADAVALRAASRALRGVTLRQASFAAVLEYARAGDFVYFDPPYDTELGKTGFTQYALPFGVAEQDALADVYRALDARGCKLMLSNSDTAANRRRYAGHRIVEIRAPRAIGRNAASRGAVTELVVCNYRGARRN